MRIDRNDLKYIALSIIVAICVGGGVCLRSFARFGLIDESIAYYAGAGFTVVLLMLILALAVPNLVRQAKADGKTGNDSGEDTDEREHP